ncbi:MAG: sigma-70 family RNA polymerase sigma factor, partial [Spirochaetales bacterium]|nr:sigma-70 family RNA polymerase sigma factor [Spirochaetales bacterium]
MQDALVEALNTALKVLPPTQRYVLEAQVFEGKTFREVSEVTGIPIDTLTARKRYAIKALSRA